MYKCRMLLLSAACVIALAGCTSGTKSGAPAPSAEAVWNADLASKAYQSWAKAPGFETPQPAKGPHGKMVAIYVDDNVTKTLGGPSATTWPTGSKIVKDALDANSALVGVEYMQRMDDGWYYASYDVAGKVTKEGVKVDPCQGCHSKGSDAVMSFKLP